MKKNYKNFLFWDWKSIVILILFFCGLAWMFNGKSSLEFKRENQFEKLELNVSVIADIISVNENYNSSQSKTGNHYNVDSYEISYKFKIGAVDYFGKDKLYTHISDNQSILKLGSENFSKVHIKYNFNNPNLSLIDPEFYKKLK